MKEKTENENGKKYDISKSNFFANIPEINNDNTNDNSNNINNIQQNNEINSINKGNLSLDSLNTPHPNSQNNINSLNSLSNINNINTTSSYQNLNFSGQNYFNQYQNQYNPINYSNITNYIPTPSPSPSFIQKMGETAMNLLKKEDVLNLIIDINPKYLQDIIDKSKKEITCQILPKSKINDITEIKAEISNPRKINDSLYKNSYILYDITTPKMNWYVNRRYSDFIWLRETLVSLFPTRMIPQLPKKKIGNRRFENDFIEKRIKGLQNFLDDILNDDILKTAECLISFLSFTERNFFEQQMKIMNPKNISIDSVLNIKTFSGKIEIADMENEEYNNNKNYFNSVETFINAQEDEIKNIKKNLKEYNVNILLACKNLEQIENGFNRLNQFYNKANLSKDICHIFEQYQIFFKNYKRIHVNQSEIIKNKLKEIFNYINNKSKSLIELIKRQNEVQSDYNKIKEDLINKKENLWKKMDISKWELNQMTQIDSALLFRDKNYAFSKMCFQETMIVNNKGDILGYYYLNNILNIKNTIDNIEKFSINNLNNFSKEIEPTVTDVVNVWSNLASNL